MSSHQFRPLPAQVDLPRLEHEVLARWRDGKVFERSLEQNATGPSWVFYEGPPTANGMPGVHHVEARVFKDVFPRYKSMNGYHVPRKAGWDCHGLPVEVAVEKELGLSGKPQIEAYGIAEFNARCRESVLRHVDAFEEMTERMGYWVDMSQAYRTMDPAYVEAVWWSLKVVFDKGLLFRDFRITPYCPRCGTGLSDHELGQPGGYETVSSPSVYVRMPVTSGRFEGVDLLIWTTTPWTLVSNTAVAVHPEVTYVVAEKDGEKPVIVAEPLVGQALGEGWSVRESFSRHGAGAHPVPAALRPGRHPRRPLRGARRLRHRRRRLGPGPPGARRSAPTTCRSARSTACPWSTRSAPTAVSCPTSRRSAASSSRTPTRASRPTCRARGLLFRGSHFEHSYPHCWRCHTPLLYYALPSWYIRTTEIKNRLLEENEGTNWFPDTIKNGRYGEWLRNNVDWALSRSRYWGTPLPLWICDEDHVTCVGSLKELGEKAGQDLSALDPHRPYVDDVTFACDDCGGEARRVPDVIDVWYDSGAMPFAQWGAPTSTRRSSRPPTRASSSARPSTRRAAGSTR